jgi:hypothetical protein
MRWLVLISCALLTTGCGLRRSDPPVPRSATAQRLVELGLADGRAYELLRELVTAAPHRLSGSAGAARAVEWGKAAMERAGLSNVRLQEVMVPCWERGEVTELMLVEPAPGGPLAVTALGGSVATKDTGLEAALVVVRHESELDKLGPAVAGKIVLFNRPMPRALRNTFAAYGNAVPQRVEGAALAARHGAAGVLVRSMTTLIDDVPHTGGMRYDPAFPAIPAAAVSTQAAERLAALAAKGEVRLRLRLSCRTRPDVLSANVIGEIEGREQPGEIVLIGGHLDCWDVGQGAHDDGAGIIHCLEAARLLVRGGLRPRRTIRVVFFMNEENGLRGAEAYARQHGGEPHAAAIESDHGGFEPKGFTSNAKGGAFDRYKRIVSALAPFEMGALVAGGGGADIQPLGMRGVPLFSLLPAWHRYFDYHHSENDTIDAVNERELQMGAVALAYLAWALAEE